MNPKVIMAVAVLSLAANGVLAALVVNQTGQIEDMTGQIEDMKNAGDSLEREVGTLKATVSIQGTNIRKLQQRPELNLDELARTLVELRNDLDLTTDDVNGLGFRLGDVEYQISKPPGCLGGDAVYWAFGFSDGLTC